MSLLISHVKSRSVTNRSQPPGAINRSPINSTNQLVLKLELRVRVCLVRVSNKKIFSFVIVKNKVQGFSNRASLEEIVLSERDCVFVSNFGHDTELGPQCD